MPGRLTLARIGRWPRLAAVAVCLLLAAVTALEDSRGATPTAPHTHAVVVAARALPVGHTLRRQDVTTAHWPDRLAPPGSSRASRTVLGRVLAGPMAAGEPLTPRRLVDPALTAGLDADVVAVPVDVDTDVRGLIAAGSRVDLLAVTRTESVAPGADAKADQVAHGVVVLAVAAGSATADTGAGSRLVLAVSRSQALRIAALRPARVFTVVLAAP